jgi:LysR family glycine cleavage system transcriptional activator
LRDLFGASCALTLGKFNRFCAVQGRRVAVVCLDWPEKAGSGRESGARSQCDLFWGPDVARRHYNLPPLSALASFEAAARHGSFKQAARELNVTPGAVSHQIKSLERELGFGLFVRQHRGVELTQSGQMLFSSLTRGFLDISTTLSHLKRVGDPSVSVAATTSVSALWLTPRLSKFWRAHGDIPVNQVLSDGIATATERPDLQILFGVPTDPALQASRLFRDHLVPMCSAQRAALLGDISLSELAQQDLVHLRTPHSKWTTWESWFRALGYAGPIRLGPVVNNYMIALQAARDGVGVVLGWERLVVPLTEQGELVRFGTLGLDAPEPFYIVCAAEESLSENARILKAWLLENI